MGKYESITEKALDKAEKLLRKAGNEEIIVRNIEAHLADPGSHSLCLDERCWQVIQSALLRDIKALREQGGSIKHAVLCGSEDGDLSSHDEKKILEGCISLLLEAGEYFREYLAFIGASPDEQDEYEKASIEMTIGHIVKRLFLYHTLHSGGTSTAAKCKQLGYNSDSSIVVYETGKEEE